MFIKRALTNSFKSAGKQYPVLLIIGSSGTGKTTFLKNLGKDIYNYVSLAPLDVREQALNDPELFLGNNPTPLIIDEIQLVPSLISYIHKSLNKIKNDKTSCYWLAATQIFSIKKELSIFNEEQLKIFKLYGLSEREINKEKQEKFISDKFTGIKTSDTPKNFFHKIWLGSYPELRSNKNIDKISFYQKLVKNYIESELNEIAQIGNKMGFYNFLKAVAARTGKMLNYAELAEESDISLPTAKSYIKILEISGIIKLIYPYKTEFSPLMVSTPKLYMLDTGLVSYLTSWNDSNAMADGAFATQIYETKCVSEIIKSFVNNGVEPNLFYYRDRATSPKEIRLILECDNVLYPIEFKRSITVTPEAVKNFDKLRVFKKNIGQGTLINFAKEEYFLKKNVKVLPVYWL